MRVFIVGRTEILYDTALLLSEHFTICGIITAAASPEYARKEEDFESLSKKFNCPFRVANSINADLNKFIEETKPDIGVSINWVSVIKEDTIRLFKHGILNSHPGDLPGYRGNAIFNWAMVRHEPEIVLSVHKMEAGELDSGNIAMKKRFPINDSTTVKELVEIWNKETPGMFLEVLQQIEAGTLEEIEQNSLGQRSFRCYPRLPIDSKIDWSATAKDIHALIRASTKPYSGAYSFLKVGDEIKKLYIWESRIVADQTDDVGTPGHILLNDRKTGESYIMTGEGVLAIKSVQYDGDEIFMPGNAWKSIRMRLGIDIESELINLYNRINRIT